MIAAKIANTTVQQGHIETLPLAPSGGSLNLPLNIASLVPNSFCTHNLKFQIQRLLHHRNMFISSCQLRLWLSLFLGPSSVCSYAPFSVFCLPSPSHTDPSVARGEGTREEEAREGEGGGGEGGGGEGGGGRRRRGRRREEEAREEEGGGGGEKRQDVAGQRKEGRGEEKRGGGRVEGKRDEGRQNGGKRGG